MSNVENFSSIKVDPKSAIAKARAEIAEEIAKKSIEALKVKYRELTKAQTVVDNINREIRDLEISISQGNV